MRALPSRGRGGIGRHAGFRCRCRKVWGFESLRPHSAAWADVALLVDPCVDLTADRVVLGVARAEDVLEDDFAAVDAQREEDERDVPERAAGLLARDDRRARLGARVLDARELVHPALELGRLRLLGGIRR